MKQYNIKEGKAQTANTDPNAAMRPSQMVLPFVGIEKFIFHLRREM